MAPQNTEDRQRVHEKKDSHDKVENLAGRIDEVRLDLEGETGVGARAAGVGEERLKLPPPLTLSGASRNK